jgi:hypothetical protein
MTTRAEIESWTDDKVITSFVYPPIPTRGNDWCAYLDNEVEDSSAYGWGRTEQDALDDLGSIIEERMEEQFPGYWDIYRTVIPGVR